jgi:hypothetical protein
MTESHIALRVSSCVLASTTREADDLADPNGRYQINRLYIPIYQAYNSNKRFLDTIN